ncbi:MAG: acyltransferase domain-containing protein [Pseudomonadales bacterium]
MSALPIVFMFSGQGSHYYHMGADLFAQQPVFRQTLLELNEIAQGLLGESIIDIMYSPQHKKMHVFEQTRHTHPAIFMVEYALAQALLTAGIKPDYVLGASMGAFAAATVAGCFNAEQALTAVIKQAEALERHCETGKMLAILDDPAGYYHQTELYTNATLAAINFDRHYVVSTNSVGLTAIESFLGQQVSYQRLAVSQAFHSPWIDPAKAVYMDFLDAYAPTFLAPQIPLICCIDAKELAQLSAAYFWQVIREAIHFQKTIHFLEERNHYRYIDLGPSGTLATFLKYNITTESNSKIHGIITPYGQEHDKLQTLIQQIGENISYEHPC